MPTRKLKTCIKRMTSKQLHDFVKCYNWDEGVEAMLEAVRHPKCDLGTALMIYWLAEPTYWFVNYATSFEVPRDRRSDFDFLLEIEEHVASGFYKTKKIKFDPGDFEGDDRTQIDRGAKWRRRVPKMMFGPYYSGPRPKPKRITVNKIKTMNSQELHSYVMTTPWDEEGTHIHAVLNNPRCDRGTALLVYWRSDPHIYDEYGDASDVEDSLVAGYKLIKKLERRLLTEYYKRSVIRFDPSNDQSTDWTRDDYYLPRRREIRKVLFKPNIE